MKNKITYNVCHIERCYFLKNMIYLIIIKNTTFVNIYKKYVDKIRIKGRK